MGAETAVLVVMLLLTMVQAAALVDILEMAVTDPGPTLRQRVQAAVVVVVGTQVQTIFTLEVAAVLGY